MYTEFRTSFYPEAAVFWFENGMTCMIVSKFEPANILKKKKQPAKDGSTELISKIIK